ncbi:hypothetical protein OHC33_005966 [Knufia fluminis]|uniref:TLC domain-containing protein n=1 Tax=Knufia fluminis TaxID=191047 RepID=A0AAN8I3L5_9EURO|nr:hypothetical protein OHC33_005966 [Knufia fluminis]
MSQPTYSPYVLVGLSTATYGAVLGSLYEKRQPHSSLRALVKAISAGHSIVATCLTIASLSQPWTILPGSLKAGSIDSADRLDDSRNPLISGKNSLANFITAWEAGYLIYDTGAMFLESFVKDRSRGYCSALIRLLRGSPVFVAHHALLIASLLWLQTYVAVGREKGLQIIMAFFLMNASNPLLHLRWWRKKSTGKSDVRVDAALAAVFAATRFGSVYWVVEKYGQYHDFGVWEAFRRQRLECQAGTGLLTGLNAVWWVGLVMQILRRKK